MMVAVAVVAVTLAGAFGTSLDRSTASAAEDPGPEVQAFIDAVNAADGAAMAASFTAEGYFEDISPANGSFGVFGTAALQSAFTDIDQEGIHVTVSAADVSGNAVSGTAEITDNTSRAAGVERYIETFDATVDGGKLASFVLHYPENDAQTSTYLDYQASQNEEDNGDTPADFIELSMSGNQPGDGGTGTSGQGAVFVFASTSGAPEGVEQPTAIYSGTCDHLGSVVQQLAPALDGGSGNLISTSMADLLGSPHALTIADSADNSSVIVSCANIVKSTGATGLPNTGTGGSSNGFDPTWLLVALALLGVSGAAGARLVGVRRP
jgi:hypothetical protein